MKFQAFFFGVWAKKQRKKEEIEANFNKRQAFKIFSGKVKIWAMLVLTH